MTMSELRKRRKPAKEVVKEDYSQERIQEPTSSKSSVKEEAVVSKTEIEPGTFWLTRIVFLRYLGFIYFVAFLVSYNQNKELLGSNGLTPAANYLLNGKCYSLP